MIFLNVNNAKNISGGSHSVTSTIDVELNNVPIEKIPTLVFLANYCVNKQLSVAEFANSMVNAGIDPSLFSIDVHMEFYTSIYKGVLDKLCQF